MNAFFPIIFLIFLSFYEGSSKIDRIAGGKIAKKGQFPFFVQIGFLVEFNETLNTTLECGATLIHPEWIISAGHCFKIEPLKFLDMAVTMGTNIKYDENGDINRVKSFVVHENYTLVQETLPNGTVIAQGVHNDIALAKLQRPYAMYKYVGVAYLPSPNIGHSTTRCKIGTIVGIGDIHLFRSHKSQLDKHVLYAVLKSKTKNELLAKLPVSNPNKFYSETKWMHGHPLPGDSGGPFVCYMDKKPVLYGLTSAAYLTPSDYHTSITEYEEVDKHLKFIVKTISSVGMHINREQPQPMGGIGIGRGSKTAAMSSFNFLIVILLLMRLQ